MILQELHRIQDRYGYLPRSELMALADRLSLPLYRLQEVISFYPHFRTTPPPTVGVRICRDMSCALRGADALADAVAAALVGEPPQRVEVSRVSCLGRCDRAVAVHVQHSPADGGHAATYQYLGRSPQELIHAVRSLLGGEQPPTPTPDRDADLPDPSGGWQINVYHGRPREERYQALRRLMQAMEQGPAAADAACERVIASALKNAVLLGMGGAGGQAYKKWCEVRQAVGERKYVICNADESEPGTFKDRELLLRTPHLVLEGLLIAGLVVGASRAYLYLRHEYEECRQAFEAELAWASEQGLCSAAGRGQGLEVELFLSPGGYICGEQTALVEALEDKRAEPRNRPPELQTNGLWDMPTLVNNVETLAWVPAILLHEAFGGEEAGVPVVTSPGGGLAGASSGCARLERSVPTPSRSWYGRQGRPMGELARLLLGNDAAWQQRHGVEPHFPGRRLFSVSGDVVRPGVYEVDNGLTVGELLKLAGGLRDGQALKAIAFSGPSGGFTPAVLPRSVWPRRVQQRLPATLTQIDIRDLQLHLNYFRVWDLMLGAGIVVYGEEADLVQQARVCAAFFAAESCGKCVPCRLGTQKLVDWLEALLAGRINAAQLAAYRAPDGPLADLAYTMSCTAICGLGTVAPQPVSSLLAHFPQELARYVA